MTTNDKLADALSSAVIQMDMAGDCIEAGRYDEALLHVRSLMRSRREVLAEHDASLAAPPAQGEFLPADEQPPFAGIAGCRPLERAPQPAPVEAELPPLPVIDEVIRFLEAGMPTPTGGFNVAPERFFGMLHDFKKARAAVAALAQQKVHVSDEMVERACKKYAFREDGALFPDDYSPREVAAERVLMREFLTHIIDQQQEARGNGE